MIELVKFLAASFACYRLAQLVTIDDGPAHIFKRYRAWVGQMAAKEQERGTQRGPALMQAELMNCPYCLGVWFALPLAILIAWDAASFIVMWPGVAGAQAFLQECTDGTRDSE